MLTSPYRADLSSPSPGSLRVAKLVAGGEGVDQPEGDPPSENLISMFAQVGTEAGPLITNVDLEILSIVLLGDVKLLATPTGTLSPHGIIL